MSDKGLPPEQQKYFEAAISQQRWFSSRSQINQSRGNLLFVTTLLTGTVAGGLAFANVEAAMKELGYATGVISGIGSIATGLDRYFRFREIGNHYRIASEEIKSHCRLFQAGFLDFPRFSEKFEETLARDLERFKEDTEEIAEKNG